MPEKRKLERKWFLQQRLQQMVYRKTVPSTATVQRGRTQTQSTVHHPPEVAGETETEKQLDTVFLTITLPSITLPSTHCSPVHPHTLSLTVVSSARGKLYLSTTSRHAFEPPPLPVCMQKSHQGKASWKSAVGVLLLLLAVIIAIIVPWGRLQVSFLPDAVLNSLPPTELGITTSLFQHSLITKGVLWGGNIFIKILFITTR